MQYAYNEAIEFHDYARHVRSSQIFCFNLLYPLIISHEVESIISKKLGIDIDKTEEWHFEYQPNKNYLGEWSGTEKPIKYITSVDFAVFLKDKLGKRMAFLMETKFTEEDFSQCGGFNSNGNSKKAFCREKFNISQVEQDCYLVSEKRRKYFKGSVQNSV